MVIMDPPISMSYRIKQLLLRAWRERWTEIEFGRSLKRLLPRCVSGDVYDLAECILKQAITGPIPNPLLMNYLNHCLTAGVVTYGSVLLAITKIPDPKPNCVSCLLEFVHKFRLQISCSGNDDECLALCRALVALLRWLYSLILNLISNSVNTGSSTTDETSIQIIRLTSEILVHLTESSFLKTLLYIGKLEEPVLWSEWYKLYMEANLKLPMINDKSLESFVQHINSIQTKVEWLSASFFTLNQPPSSFSTTVKPLSYTAIVKVAIKQLTNQSTYITYRPIAFRCLQSVISFSAVLDPAMAVEVTANQIAMISRFFNISLSQIYCDTLHSCITCLIDAQKLNSENSSKLHPYYHTWCAFFLFKIPQIFQLLSQQMQSTDFYAPNELEIGLDLLSERGPLLDLFDNDYTPEFFQRLLEEFTKKSLLSSKAAEKFLESRKISKNSVSANDSTSSILVARAEQTLTSVIDSFNSDNHETLLGILCRLQKSLEVMLCTTASLNIMSKFAHKLVNVNEMSKSSSGENLRTSQLRAVLFDISFLSLCTLVQNYGTEVVTNNLEIKDTFFFKWCSLNFGPRSSPEIMLSSFTDTTKVEPLLSQFIVSNPNAEFKTSLVRWNDMCIASQLAVSEILPAWCHDVLTTDAVHLVLNRLKSRLCSTALSAACWLFAQLNVASQEQSLKIMTMLNELKNWPSNEEKNKEESSDNSDSMMYYNERFTMFQTIMKRLFEKYLPNTFIPSNVNLNSPKKFANLSPMIPLRLSRSSLNVLLDMALESTKGVFNMKNIYDFDGLMAIGGAHWFTNSVINFLFNLTGTRPCEISRLQEAVDLAFGLFHLDLEQCALVLLRDTIPRLLLFKPRQEKVIVGFGIELPTQVPFLHIPETKVTALVKLTIMTAFGAISQIQSLKKAGLNRRSGNRGNYENISQQWYYNGINDQMLDNTSFIYEQKQSSKLVESSNGLVNDSGDSTNITPMDVDILDHQSNQEQSIPNEGNNTASNRSEILKEPLFVEFIRFLNLLMDLCLDGEFTPRSLVLPTLLEQIVLCLREDSHLFLQFVPFHLLDSIIRSTYDTITYEQLLAYLSLDSVRSRKIGARLLCNLQLQKSSVDTFKYQS